jgi:hypothetical protein
MGTITVNVQDEVEVEFRAVVRIVHGSRKGSLGKALTEAMETWIAEKRQAAIAERARKRLEKGFHLGTKRYESRAELYER